MIPNQNCKILSGWINNSCKVIIYKMMETEMGNRGTISEISYLEINKYSVKAQRVDDNRWNFVKKSNLRCTLLDLEKGYQPKILSTINNYNRTSFFLYKRHYSTSIPVIDPWFITGFSDAECCFSIGITKNKNLINKWRIRANFSIILHKKDLLLLESLKSTLGVGKIYISGNNAIRYNVSNIPELKVIINHFDFYPLISQKLSDFLVFKQCVEIIEKGEHLTKDGFLKIINLRSSLNLGLSDEVKKAFPNIIINKKIIVGLKEIPDPFWISGFVSGEGSFNFVLNKLKTRSKARFAINLHIRDLNVLKSILFYLKLNDSKINNNNKNKYIHERENSVQLQISKMVDIEKKIIFFFDKYPLSGIKRLDFEDFKKGFILVRDSSIAKTPLDINILLNIISNMNIRRKC